jgi:hypothetical protein
MNEAFRVGLRIGKRNSCRILCNAAIVREARDCFYVRERRPAQFKPLGLEDDATRLIEDGGWSLQQHGQAP